MRRITLPLLNPTTILVDNSTLELLRCPREMAYKVGYRRVPAVPKPSQFFGQGIHIGLATRFIENNGDAVTNPSSIHSAITQHFSTTPTVPNDHRTLDFSLQVMDAYNDLYRKEPFRVVHHNGKPIVESSFMEQLGVINVTSPVDHSPITYNVMYAGRLDLAIIDNEGEWVWDNKTAYQFGSSWDEEMAILPAMRGYMWGFSKITGKMPRGYKINGIRVRPPTKEALDDPSKRVRPKEDFRRLTFHIQPEEISEWQTNALLLVREMAEHFTHQSFPQKKNQCVSKYGKCSFYDVCGLPESNREEYISSGLFEDYTWSPINIPE